MDLMFNPLRPGDMYFVALDFTASGSSFSKAQLEAIYWTNAYKYIWLDYWNYA